MDTQYVLTSKDILLTNSSQQTKRCDPKTWFRYNSFNGENIPSDGFI